MIVPFARGQASQPQQAQPSETDMLMALAAMHSMGRIPTGDNLGIRARVPAQREMRQKNLDLEAAQEQDNNQGGSK